jgi:hypothetical protein
MVHKSAVDGFPRGCDNYNLAAITFAPFFMDLTVHLPCYEEGTSCVRTALAYIVLGFSRDPSHEGWWPVGSMDTMEGCSMLVTI